MTVIKDFMLTNNMISGFAAFLKDLLQTVKSLYEIFSNWKLRCVLSTPVPLRIEGFTLLDTEVREVADWQELQRSLQSLPNICSYC